MTNTQSGDTNLVVVDGSNIATEGRSVPSLAQLNDAVLSLTSEFPDITVTVVVDATFGHRIDRSEVAEFDEAVAHNELVTPPAGAIGRGDAFVLSIANKVGARIFSNDSFQEFHGVYPWLFDEGRLIGGKPVPHVGWVFVNRVPVKGPVSRKARGAGRDSGASRRTVSKLASLPMPIPTSPPPGRSAATAAAGVAVLEQATGGSGQGRRRRWAEPVTADAVPATGREAAQPTAAAAPVSGGPVNDLLPFLDFVQHNPVGGSVVGVVESYSSHGAYVTVGDVRGYVPLRLMSTPPPRSAREVMKIGERVTLVVASFAPPRRSIDLAVPGAVEVPVPDPVEPSPKRRAKKASAPAGTALAAETLAPVPEPAGRPADDGTTSPRGRRKKAAAAAPPEAAVVPPDTAATPSDVAAEQPATSRRRRKGAAPETQTTGEPAVEKPAKKTAAAKSVAATAAKSAAKRATSTRPAATVGSVPAKRSRSKQPAATDPSTSPAGTTESIDVPKKAASRRGGSKKAAAKAAAAQPGTVEPATETTTRSPRRRRSTSNPTE